MWHGKLALDPHYYSIVFVIRKLDYNIFERRRRLKNETARTEENESIVSSCIGFSNFPCYMMKKVVETAFLFSIWFFTLTSSLAKIGYANART